MSIPVALLSDTRIVQCDERTGSLGGSFYNNPHLQPYSPLPLRWCFDQLIRYEHATLIDVGASTGAFTLLSALHPDLTVHSFEPVPLTRRVLQENVYLNNLNEKVIINSCGVSNYDGKGILHSVKDIGGSGVSLVDGLPAVHKDCDDIEIDVVTLDSYCALHGIEPRFVKCDTEGGELRVLQGAKETIEKYHPFLLIETSQENANQYGYNTHEVVKMVEEWGYQWRSPEGLDLWCVHRDWEKMT